MHEKTAWYLGHREKTALTLPWQEEERASVPLAPLGTMGAGAALRFGAEPVFRAPSRDAWLDVGHHTRNNDLNVRSLARTRDMRQTYVDALEQGLVEPPSQYADIAAMQQRANAGYRKGEAEMAAKARMLEEEIPEGIRALQQATRRKDLIDAARKATPVIGTGLMLGGLGLAGYDMYRRHTDAQ